MKTIFKNKFIFFFFVSIFFVFSSNAQELSIQTGHSATINDVEFSENDKYLISCGADNKVIIWDMKTFMQMKILEGHKAAVNSVAMWHGTNKFATASDDKTVKIWNYPEAKTLKTYHFCKEVKDISFSPDGDKLACATDSIIIIDLKTDNRTKLNIKAKKFFTTIEYSSNGAYLAFSGKHEFFVRIYELTYGNFINKFRSQANSICFSTDSRFIFSAGDNGVLKRRPVNKSSLKKYTIWANNSWDTFFDIVVTDEFFIASNRNNLIYIYENKTADRKALLNAHTNDPRTVAVSSNGKYLASAGKDQKIIIWNLKRFSVTKILESAANSITSLSFSDDGNYIFLTYKNGQNKIWNLANKGQILTVSAPKLSFFQDYFMKEYTSLKTFYQVNPKKVFVLNSIDKISRNTEKVKYSVQKPFIWDIKNYGKKYFIKNRKKETYKQYFISDTNSLIEIKYNATHLQDKSLIGGEKILDRQKVYSAEVYNYAFSKKINKKRIKPEDDLHLDDEFTIDGDVYYVNISPDGEFLLAFKNTKYNRICDLWDLEISDKISTVILDKKYNKGGFSPNSKYFYIASDKDSIIKIFELSAQKLIDSVKGSTPFAFAENKDICSYTDKDKNIYLYNFRKNELIFKVNSGHQTSISDINFNIPYNYLATVAYDGLIKFWSIKTGEPIISLAAFGKSDFIYISPDNYYYSTKGAMKNIGFLLNNKLYTFDQFDIKYNRPDTVLSRLDYTTKEEIKIYKKAYKKRIKKMGFSNFIFDENYNIPEVKIKNLSQIPISTNGNNISIKIFASDSIYNLSKINIYVNSVPIFGTKGKDISNLNKKTFSKEFKIILSSGKNKIDVTATNEQGVKSLKKSFSVICEKEANPKLYIVSIGISKYKDTTLNLDFAEKDAADVITLFKKRNKIFDNIKTFKIVNEQATRENILSVKDSLMETEVNDQVILFFAGHGLLDESYNYYLTTHDFDYQNFFKTVIAYDDFIDILDSIPARKKVVFIDACHSGEIDKEQDENNTGAVILNNENTAGSRSLWSLEYGNIPGFGSQSTFELMKLIFTDLRRGSGTTIISSAGGKEFAYESKKIKNGVFTYVLINGLKSKEADLDNNGQIMLSELQDYVMKTVSRITKGRQNPTNRRVNLDYDFIMWK